MTAPQQTPVAWAVAYAQSGFSVFPCLPDKKPAIKGWQEAATTDQQQIQAWATMFPDCRWGCACGPSNLFVVDVDRAKDGGQGGEDSLALLLADNPQLPPTYTVRTRSGGRHLYFRGRGATSAGKLGRRLDTRSAGGYVIIPDGKDYSVITEAPIAEAPTWLIERAGKPKEKSADSKAVLVEAQAADMAAAAAWLCKAAPKCEMGSRDITTYQVGAHLRSRFALDLESSATLMNELWAADGWTGGDILRVLRSLYGGNAARGQGEDHPRAVFSRIELLETPLAEDVEELPQAGTAWLVEGYIPRDGLTLLYGESNVYKSFLALALAYHIATGRPWCGQEVEQGPVLYIAGEGASGLKSRGMAWKLHHGLREKLPVFYRRVPTAFSQQAQILEIKRHVQTIEERRGPLAALVVDTVAGNFGPGDESSNRDMAAFLAGINESTGHRAARILIHHSGQQNRERERGAYSLRASLDAAYRVSRAETAAGPACLMRPDKMRDDEYPEPRAFIATRVGLGMDEKGRERSSIVLCETPASNVAVVRSKPMTEQQAKLLELVRTAQPAMGQAVPIDSVAQLAVDKAHYTRASTARRAIERLSTAGHLRISGEEVVCIGC